MHAFAALRKDGSVVTWGENESGGDSSLAAPSMFFWLLRVTFVFFSGGLSSCMKEITVDRMRFVPCDHALEVGYRNQRT